MQLASHAAAMVELLQIFNSTSPGSAEGKISSLVSFFHPTASFLCYHYLSLTSLDQHSHFVECSIHGGSKKKASACTTHHCLTSSYPSFRHK
jgi:hypothetical protein